MNSHSTSKPSQAPGGAAPARPASIRRAVGRAAFILLLLAGCDHGLVPPEAPAVGAIRGVVTYVDPAAWPPPASDSLKDLRFFALPFVPRDTLDLFRDLNQLVFSEQLAFYVTSDTFFVDNVEARAYVYSGVAQQFSDNLLDWRPVGLYTDDGGVFLVRPGAVTELAITVDFRQPPVFPPLRAER